MECVDVKRGALIVFEECDRTEKSTQCQKIVDKLRDVGVMAELMKVPDRTTVTGMIINNYLTEEEELPDQAIHSLFAANRRHKLEVRGAVLAKSTIKMTNFFKLKENNWMLVDGSRSIEEIHKELLKHAVEAIEKVKAT